MESSESQLSRPGVTTASTLTFDPCLSERVSRGCRISSSTDTARTFTRAVA